MNLEVDHNHPDFFFYQLVFLTTPGRAVDLSANIYLSTRVPFVNNLSTFEIDRGMERIKKANQLLPVFQNKIISRVSKDLMADENRGISFENLVELSARDSDSNFIKYAWGLLEQEFVAIQSSLQGREDVTVSYAAWAHIGINYFSRVIASADRSSEYLLSVARAALAYFVAVEVLAVEMKTGSLLLLKDELPASWDLQATHEISPLINAQASELDQIRFEGLMSGWGMSQTIDTANGKYMVATVLGDHGKK
jgi:hypothetical protein